MAIKLSVIIPLHPKERGYWNLLQSLCQLPHNTTEILVTVSSSHIESVPTDAEHRISQSYLEHNVPSLTGRTIKWLVCSKAGRADQMNEAALAARGQNLWFLHADSHINRRNIELILKVCDDVHNYLYYFDLKFYSGSRMMYINALCVWFRCRLFGLPFGDQAFLIQNDVFHRLGGYNSKAEYGEDHLLVWKAKQSGVPVVPIGGSIRTSARKYMENGWLKTTSQHFRMFTKQAFPQYKIYKSGKVK